MIVRELIPSIKEKIMRLIIGFVFSVFSLLFGAFSTFLVMMDVWWIQKWETTETTYYEWVCKLIEALSKVSGEHLSQFWVWFIYLGFPVLWFVFAWYFVYRYSEQLQRPRRESTIRST